MTNDTKPSSPLERMLEAMAGLVEAYAALIRLEISQGISKAIGVTALVIMVSTALASTFFFINVTAAILIGDALGGEYWLGFLIISAFYLLVTLIMIIRAKWVIRLMGKMAIKLLDVDKNLLLQNKKEGNGQE